jgi:hypothetical protein
LPYDTLYGCQGDIITLDAGTGYDTYQWSSGGNAQTENVTTAGIYYVTVSKSGLFENDSVEVVLNTAPVVDLGPDRSILDTQSIVLDAGAGFAQYLWSDMSTGQTLLVDGAALGIGTYVYWVEATSAGGCVRYDTLSVSVDSVPGSVLLLLGDARISMFPNPTEDVINLNISGIAGIFNVRITSSLGVKIIEKTIAIENSKNETIDLKKYPEGTYFITISAEGVEIKEKIIRY